MENRILKRLLATGISQLILIAVSVVLGYYFTRYYSIVPKAVLRLPEVYVSQSDMWSTVKIFVIAYGLQLFFTNWKFRTPATHSVSRFASEYIYYLIAYTSASMYLFLATTINYDAQFVAAVGLFSSILYVLCFSIQITLNNGSGFLANLGQSIAGLCRRLFSLSGVLTLIYFLVPLAMGKAFSSDRDIANKITQVRIWFNPVAESEWGFRNFLPGKVFQQPVLARQAPQLYRLNIFPSNNEQS